MISNEVLEIRSNDLIMESLHEIAMDLPPIERSQYVNIVTEAIATNPEAQYRIISKLAKQVENLQEIDLDQCRKSGGNITKYSYYDVLNKAMEIINDSEYSQDIQNVQRMNKIHNILLDNADDFIWGYKHNDKIVTKMYIMMTRYLFILIDLSISDYIKTLDMQFKFNSKIEKTPSKIICITRDIDRIIRLFENGDWRNLMSACRKSATNRSIKALDEMDKVEGASEAATTIDVKTAAGIFTDPISWFKDLGTGGKVAVAVIVILLTYRKVAFFIGKLGAKFSSVFRHCAELVKSYDSANRNQNDSAVEKHNKFYNFMVGTADRIDAFFTKASRETEKQIAEENRKDFNTNEITQIQGIDFGV